MSTNSFLPIDAENLEFMDDDNEEEFEEEPPLCYSCNGSGEGMYDGSTCRVCRGSGVH